MTGPGFNTRKYYDLTRERVLAFTDAELIEGEQTLFVQVARIEATLEYKPETEWRMNTVAAYAFRKFDLAVIQFAMFQRGLPTLSVSKSPDMPDALVKSVEKHKLDRAYLASQHSLAVEYQRQAEKQLDPVSHAAILTAASAVLERRVGKSFEQSDGA